MRKVSYKEIERLSERLMAQHGECIIIANDGESEDTICSVHCFDKASAGGLIASFFESHPELIPVALHAIALAMDGIGDEEEYDDLPIGMN